MSYEWLEMQREAERHAQIEQYLRRNLVTDVYGSPQVGSSSPSHALRAAHVVAPLDPRAAYAAPALAPLTTGDKVRMTFQDLDFNKNGVVDGSEFQRGFDQCKLQLSEPSVTDLFNKAKGGKTGDLTEPEWYRFITQYPMLLDALFHRFRAAHDADRNAEAARDAQQRFRERAEHLRREVEAAEKQDADSAGRLAEDEDRWKAAQEKVQGSEEQYQAALQEVKESVSQREATEAKVASEWERTRAQRIRASEAERDVDIAQRRQRAAEERVRWAEEALRAAQAEKEQADTDLAAAEDRRKEVEVPEGQNPELVLQDADRRVADAQRNEYEVGAAFTENRAAEERARWHFDEQKRKSDAARARLQQARAALEDAEKQIEENEQRLADAENVKQNGVTVDEKENKLVEQEVRLKEQREVLEQEEASLQRDCNEYTARVSPQRERAAREAISPYARSPYTPTKAY